MREQSVDAISPCTLAEKLTLLIRRSYAGFKFGRASPWGLCHSFASDQRLPGPQNKESKYEVSVVCRKAFICLVSSSCRGKQRTVIEVTDSRRIVI
jgi:hypothetical protein